MQIVFKLCLATFLIFWLSTLAAPLYVDIVLLVLAYTVVKKSSPLNLTILCASLLVCSGGLEVFFQLNYWGPGFGFYRAHEKYLNGQRYMPNIEENVRMPHGDLASIDINAPRELWEPRNEYFKTDSLGYRNSAEYKKGSHIINGDSFALGIGTDYADTIPAILRDKYGIENYSIAFPAAPGDYERNAKDILNKVSEQSKILMFIFEGNDFNIQESGKSSASLQGEIATTLDLYDAFKFQIINAFESYLIYPRRLGRLQRMLEKNLYSRHGEEVEYFEIASRKVAFLKLHRTNSQAAGGYINATLDPNVWNRVACTFFVPGKSRVYKNYLPEQIASEIKDPPPLFTSLAKSLKPFDTEMVDLSPTLQAAAEEYLEKGEFVFWRDDTHWNGNGMNAVAPVIAECIKRRS